MAKDLLTKGNRNLGRHRIWAWTLPAGTIEVDEGVLPNGGTVFNVCPSAGICRPLCYARQNTYRYKNVKQAHLKKLLMVLNDLQGWEDQMNRELDNGKKFFGAHVRIHDAGDFFSDEYLVAWLRIIENHPDTHFYCYTKEVKMFHRMVDGKKPKNFDYVFSLGGIHDKRVKPGDRVADVFYEEADIASAQFTSQTENDLISVLAPSRLIGIAANKIPFLRKAMRGKRFSELQADRGERKRLFEKDKPADFRAIQPEGRTELPLLFQRDLPEDWRPHRGVPRRFGISEDQALIRETVIDLTVPPPAGGGGGLGF